MSAQQIRPFITHPKRLLAPIAAALYPTRRKAEPVNNRKLATALAVVLFLPGCAAAATPAPTTAASAVPPPGASPVALLNALTIEPEDTGAVYRRPEWGESWAYHGDGCDTRELVLFEQGQHLVHGKGCKPLCPEDGPPCWTSPYDGKPAHHRDELEIDHRVPVAEAARSRVVGTGKGAARVWSAAQKNAFYEDRANLVAVTAAVNSGKRDGDAGRWKPPADGHWCAYATAYMRTKIDHRLTVDQAEHNGLRQMVNTCPAHVRDPRA